MGHVWGCVPCVYQYRHVSLWSAVLSYKKGLGSYSIPFPMSVSVPPWPTGSPLPGVWVKAPLSQ